MSVINLASNNLLFSFFFLHKENAFVFDKTIEKAYILTLIFS